MRIGGAGDGEGGREGSFSRCRESGGWLFEDDVAAIVMEGGELWWARANCPTGERCVKGAGSTRLAIDGDALARFAVMCDGARGEPIVPVP